MNTGYSLKKVSLFILLALALIGIPLTVYIAQRQQETRTGAQVVSEDSVVVIIDGQEYTKADGRKIAEEYSDPSTVSAGGLSVALDILIERKILDKAEKDLSIQIDQASVNNFIQAGFSETDARYETLREQVILKAVKSRRAESLRFWNPPETTLNSLTSEEKTAAEAQLSDGIPALTEAESRMRQGEDIFTIGDSLLVKYPTLVPVLGVNGYILSGMDQFDRAEAKIPPIYEFGDSNLDNDTLDKLFSLNAGEAGLITETDGNRGGSVFKLIEIGNPQGLVSYDTWFSQQEVSLVKVINPL